MGIAAIYIKSSADDVALVKVGEGISAEPFTLANESLKIGDQAELTGHGQTHDYTPSVLTVISERVAFLNFGNVTYTDLFKETSATLSRSCGGGERFRRPYLQRHYVLCRAYRRRIPPVLS